jgi:hypothetical protein
MGWEDSVQARNLNDLTLVELVMRQRAAAGAPPR